MKLVKSIALCASASAIVAMAPVALADEPGSEPAAPPPAAAQPPAPPAPPAPEAEEEPAIKKFTITANPLSIAVGRYSVNFEYMLAQHHGIIAVPSIWMMSASAGSSEWKYRYLGGELGYHFYTGDRGANGFFVGPSFVYMNMHTSTNFGVADTSTSVYGAAIDIGGQHVARNGFTIGGGFGLMYLKVGSKVEGSSEPTVNVDGVLPRFLFTIGYSF